MPIPPVRLSLSEIEEAASTIRGIAWRTPLVPASRDEEKLYLKLECLQRTGSFKIRGAWNRMSRATPEEKLAGFVTASAGNHGQAVAWCARKLGALCKVYVPETAVQSKLSSMESMGAQIVRKPVKEIMALMADDRMNRLGMTYVPPFGDTYVVAGQGTIGIEVLEDLPSVSTILVPVGGGGLAAGIATAVKALKPNTKVYGVQAEGAAPLPKSMSTGVPQVLDSISTIADGIGATRVFDYMLPILREKLDGALVVSDDEIKSAMRSTLLEAHAVVEPAGGAALAAARRYAPELDAPIVCISSGGNCDPALLAEVVKGQSKDLS